MMNMVVGLEENQLSFEVTAWFSNLLKLQLLVLMGLYLMQLLYLPYKLVEYLQDIIGVMQMMISRNCEMTHVPLNGTILENVRQTPAILSDALNMTK